MMMLVECSKGFRSRRRLECSKVRSERVKPRRRQLSPQGWVHPGIVTRLRLSVGFLATSFTAAMSALGTGAQSVPRPTTLVHTRRFHHTHACTKGVRGIVAKLSALAEVIPLLTNPNPNPNQRSSLDIRADATRIRADATRFAFATYIRVRVRVRRRLGSGLGPRPGYTAGVRG